MESISTVTEGLSQIKVRKKVVLLPKKLSEDVSAMERSGLKTNREQLAANADAKLPQLSSGFVDAASVKAQQEFFFPEARQIISF